MIVVVGFDFRAGEVVRLLNLVLNKCGVVLGEHAERLKVVHQLPIASGHHEAIELLLLVAVLVLSENNRLG